MQLEKVEGLVLQALPYQDHHHIVTAFTQERGVIRLFVRKSFTAIASPLTRAELIYALPRGHGLFRLRDATILDQHLNLRQNFSALQSAGSMVSKIIHSQLLLKPAPALYQLLLTYLKRAADNPQALSASFTLKLLKHEGLLSLRKQCSSCGAPLVEAYAAGGELLCGKHAPSWAIPLLELPKLTFLLESRSLAAIASQEVGDELLQNVEKLFKCAKGGI